MGGAFDTDVPMGAQLLREAHLARKEASCGRALPRLQMDPNSIPLLEGPCSLCGIFECGCLSQASGADRIQPAWSCGSPVENSRRLLQTFNADLLTEPLRCLTSHGRGI